MIIVTREYTYYPYCPSTGGSKHDTEFKVFADDDVQGLQEYLDQNNGTFSFKKL